MISLRDNFNPVKREERREGGGREGGKNRQRIENIIKLRLLNKCQTTKILA